MFYSTLKRARKSLEIPDTEANRKKLERCGGKLKKFQSHLDTLKREWTQSRDPEEWVYRLVLLNIEEKFPNCKIIDKGIIMKFFVFKFDALYHFLSDQISLFFIFSHFFS